MRRAVASTPRIAGRNRIQDRLTRGSLSLAFYLTTYGLTVIGGDLEGAK